MNNYAFQPPTGKILKFLKFAPPLAPFVFFIGKILWKLFLAVKNHAFWHPTRKMQKFWVFAPPLPLLLFFWQNDFKNEFSDLKNTHYPTFTILAPKNISWTTVRRCVLRVKYPKNYLSLSQSIENIKLGNIFENQLLSRLEGKKWRFFAF